MVDNGSEETGLDPALRALGWRVAAGSGALFALWSLIRHVPPHVAALRGTLALVAVLLGWRFGLFALERALAADAAAGAAAGTGAAEPVGPTAAETPEQR